MQYKEEYKINMDHKQNKIHRSIWIRSDKHNSENAKEER